MAYPEKWLRSKLDEATTAGIHPILAPQNAPFPLVVYRRTGTRRERDMIGNVGRPIATFSVSIVAETTATPRTSPRRFVSKLTTLRVTTLA